jgi:acyl-CoA dehydrogenase
MNFDQPERVQHLQDQVTDFMNEFVWPVNAEWLRVAQSGDYPLAIMEGLKERARAAGLWNLFLPALRDYEPGTRLTNLEYAPLAEIIGRAQWASEVFNCNAPDTGNMELLHMFATPQQRKSWLDPLLQGEIRSCFAMTEPDVASSDATNICTTIKREGDTLVINGRKWFTTGALHPNCRVCIVMGVSDPEAGKHRRHSMVLVPMKTPGMRIVRNVPIMNHHSPEGHCEVVFDDVRVPVANLLGESGQGFEMAQARLGPGRVHHCMRTIGQCELALELMCDRALSRRTFGRALSEYANVRDWIAHARVRIDQARLLVLRAAWLMDRDGNASARVDVSAIKLVAADLHTFVLDRAIQIFGAMGLTPETPLADLWIWGRAMHFIDGPDEVHLRTIARDELERAKTRTAKTASFYIPSSVASK